MMCLMTTKFLPFRPHLLRLPSHHTSWSSCSWQNDAFPDKFVIYLPFPWLARSIWQSSFKNSCFWLGGRKSCWTSQRGRGSPIYHHHLFYTVNLLQQVSSLIGADAKEIVFTSGATESNNMAIKGVAHFYQKKKNHIITTATVCLSWMSHSSGT